MPSIVRTGPNRLSVPRLPRLASADSELMRWSDGMVRALAAPLDDIADIIAGQQSGAAKGLVRISGGAITSPVAYVDIELPTQYGRLLLWFDGRTPSQLSFAVSTDGGATFLCDATNYDTYTVISAGLVANTPPPSWQADQSTDSLGYLSAGHERCSVLVRIDPGAADNTFLVVSEENSLDAWPGVATLPTLFAQKQVSLLNSQATVSPTLGRVNLLRLLPYGNGDCNPPTSGDTISEGNWVLWGVLP